jgi:GT2 family glycosyltransferase
MAAARGTRLMAAPARVEAAQLPAPSSTQPQHDVCAIVVSHNSGDWLGPALSSLFEHAGEVDLDVVVVDNGDDGSGRKAAARFDRVRAIECANHGFAHANNRGAVTADARYLLLLNPDVEVLDGELADLVSHMDAHPEIGIAGCRQVDGEGGLWPTARRFPGVARALGEAIGPERLGLGAWLGETELDLPRYDGELSCDWISGSFLLIRREALANVGLLDERFFFYSEEVDLCLRVKREGWEIRHLPQFEIAHYGGSTDASPRMEAQMAYARSQYAAKHFSPLRRLAFVGAIGLRHLTRWVAFSMRGESGRAAAHKRALMTLLGRVEPPFGPPRSAR